MKKYHHLYKIIPVIIVTLISCSSYREIRIDGHYNAYEIKHKNPYYVIIHSPEYKDIADNKPVHYSRIRYLAVKSGDSNLDIILKRSYSEIKNGNYHSASILLHDASGIWNNGACENNLAVINEIRGNKDLAFSLYTRALLLSPDNNTYKKNFSGLLNRTIPGKKE